MDVKYIHTVSIVFKEDANTKAFFQELRNLCLKLAAHGVGIESYTHREHDGSEVPNKGLHLFELRFASGSDFNKYLRDPLHQAFVARAFSVYVEKLGAIVNSNFNTTSTISGPLARRNSWPGPG